MRSRLVVVSGLVSLLLTAPGCGDDGGGTGGSGGTGAAGTGAAGGTGASGGTGATGTGGTGATGGDATGGSTTGGGGTGGSGGMGGGGGGGMGGGGGAGGGPNPSCVHPTIAMLDANDGPGVTDIAFDADCNAYLASTVSGTDTMYVIDGLGNTSTISGFSNYDMTAIALDPSSSDIFVAHNADVECHVGSSVAQATFTDIATGVQTGSALWSNFFNNQCQPSIAMDSAGCIWVPNLEGVGTLGCTTSAGVTTAVLSGLGHIESVGLDAAENLYISIGAEIHSVDQGNMSTALFHTAGNAIRDFVFTADGELYIETVAGEIERRLTNGTSVPFRTVQNDGRLAITPDGWLVRVESNPVGAAVYQEWKLPSAGCVHPDVATLDANDGNGVTDVVFDENCNAYLGSTVSGTDTMYVIDNAGTTTTITGFSNLNMKALALDPMSSNIYLAMDTNAECHVGTSIGQATVTDLASGLQTASALWSNIYVNRCQSSIAMDSAGCIWVPNFEGDGTLGCMDTAGTTTGVLTGLGYIESVGLDADETLYISIGAEIFSVDTTNMTTALFHGAGGDVLDFVFDANGDLYVEVDGGTIERRTAGGSTSTFQTSTGQGKLSIAPDGWLVRTIPNPVGAASYEEWMLP